jgi:dynein heavy chain
VSVYPHALDAFEEQLLHIFDYGLATTNAIPELEPLIMDNMFWGKDNFLKTLHKEEAGVAEMRARVKAAAVRAGRTLYSYLKTFDVYRPLLRRKVKPYLEDLASLMATERWSLAELLEELNAHKVFLELIEDKVPMTIAVGPFMLTCNVVRDYLLNKQKEVRAFGEIRPIERNTLRDCVPRFGPL